MFEVGLKDEQEKCIALVQTSLRVRAVTDNNSLHRTIAIPARVWATEFLQGLCYYVTQKHDSAKQCACFESDDSEIREDIKFILAVQGLVTMPPIDEEPEESGV